MGVDIAKANHYARMSCSRWCGPKTKPGRIFLSGFYRLIRYFYRRRYRGLVFEMSQETFEEELEKTMALERLIGNTYPPPYSHPDFANWDEDDSKYNYSLVSDDSGFVVKHCTSYCAYKISECTGHWPKRKTPIKMHAKDWLMFLREAGYSDIVDGLELRDGHKYVGIDSRYGKNGLVVWFEWEGNDRLDQEHVWVSTYREKKYIFKVVDVNRFTWIQIK